jgi:DNA-binding winged helix-turn-helix (wHTH) protein/tetratricopeptide (TPR) repeat protein
MLGQPVAFGPYRLDPRGGLVHGRRPVRLTPRAFSLLCFLAAQPGRVVPKEEIFRSVWRGTAVGDAALATCVQEIRRALRDKAIRPRYIETVHRRGYRFNPAQGGDAAEAPEPPGFAGKDATLLVGRRGETDELDQALAAARGGSREVVFVAGEPGIGKTALIRAFLARAPRSGVVRVAWGQSAEHYGPSEPYHPILDALSRAARGASGRPLLQALDKHAPLWLAQMPSLVSAARLRTVQRRCVGAPPERMQRELTDALEAAAAETPLVLWLEDLHWADAPTLDWLAAFARRPEPVRMLLLGTFRPAEARAVRHPLHALGDELARQGRARTLTLGPLTRAAVQDYLSARFPPRADAVGAMERFAGEVHERTEGSPLFMVGVLDDVLSRGLLQSSDGAWSLAGDAAPLRIPAYLREMIDRQIDRLDAAGLRLLETGAVAGLRFACALVGAAVDRPASEVEKTCAEIARQNALILPAGAEEWPDGTVSSRFGFAHALYREALAERLPAALGVEIHRRVGNRLAAAYGPRAGEVAGQLAMHFECGRDRVAAVRWLQEAGDASMRRKAAREAAAHYEHALELQMDGPAGRARDEARARLHLALCMPLIALYGMGSPRVEQCAREAHSGCAALGDKSGQFAARRVLWNNSLMRNPVAVTVRHAQALMAQAKASRDAAELALAYRAHGSSLIYTGEHRQAARVLAHGFAIADRVDDAAFERYGEHPGMVCRAFCAWPKAFMGRAADAVRLSDDSIAHARRRDEPHGLAFALVTAGLVDIFQRDAERAAANAAEVSALAEQYRFAQWIAFAHEIEGWAVFQRGDRSRGIGLIEEALSRLHATGARTHSSRVLANLAECNLVAGRVADARRHLDAGFRHRAEHGEQYYAPELYRLDALILRAENAPPARIRAALRKGLDIARQQHAGLFAKRILRDMAISMASAT